MLYGAKRLHTPKPPVGELPGGMFIRPQTAWRLRGRMLAFSLAPLDAAFGSPLFQVDILFDMSKAYQWLHTMFRPHDARIDYIYDGDGGIETRVNWGDRVGTGGVVLMHILLPAYDRLACLQSDLTARIFGHPADVGETVEFDAWAICTTQAPDASTGFTTKHFDYQRIGRRVHDRAARTIETQCPWLVPFGELELLAACNAEREAAESPATC